MAIQWSTKTPYRNKMESRVCCGDVHTGQTQGQGPEPIVSIVSVPFPILVPVPFLCSMTVPLHRSWRSPAVSF